MLNCTGCGTEASPGFAFCPQCGQRLPRLCPGCGFACEANFAFCPRCGISVGAGTNPGPTGAAAVTGHPAVAEPKSPAPTAGGAGRDADRRQVTVLFADLSGFTTLAERLDPEDVRAFQNALFETLAQAIAPLRRLRGEVRGRRRAGDLRRARRSRGRPGAGARRRPRHARARARRSASDGPRASASPSPCTSGSTPARSWPAAWATPPAPPTR